MDIFNAGVRVACCISCVRRRRIEVDRQACCSVFIIGNIDSSAALQVIRAGSTIQVIISVTADEGVVTAESLQNIIAYSGATVQDIRQRVPGQRIVEI